MIMLCTLNARYIHSSLSLRYLYANMGELQEQTHIKEFSINQRPIDIAEHILDQNPDIIGFGLYIWNISQTTEVISIVKTLNPHLEIILGGPEISYETELNPVFEFADFVIRGQGDFAFAQLCNDIQNNKLTSNKIINAPAFNPRQLNLPYQYYSDEDIRQRVLYVEASRGCPFKCEFCLSSLDKTAQAFDIDEFLMEMETLYQRGARHFKFVDRTFNLNINSSRKILQYFLHKPLNDLFLHFELIPDRLPDGLKDLIKQFPAGALQFEIGIQTFNPVVQQTISRKQDHNKTLANLLFLRNETNTHLHTDLIAGLPAEDLQSFAHGFDLLVSLKPQEIQLGILKRLRGAPLIRHSETCLMIYNPNPPYNILSTRDMNRQTLFRLNRFARYWDMIANSGRFTHTLPILLGDGPFANFMALSDWLFETTKQTHKIALSRLFKLLYQYSNEQEMLEQDFNKTGIKSSFLSVIEADSPRQKKTQAASIRQKRHLSMNLCPHPESEASEQLTVK